MLLYSTCHCSSEHALQPNTYHTSFETPLMTMTHTLPPSVGENERLRPGGFPALTVTPQPLADRPATDV